MAVGVVFAAVLCAGAAPGEAPVPAADPGLFAEPRADASPTPFACTVETLGDGARCVFESAAPAAADPARQALENAAEMVFSVPELVAYLSRHCALAPGDLIFTGTPAGVGAVQRGDSIVAGIDGLDTLRTTIV